MRLIFSALSGALFELGLLLSGMTDTKKVQGWLDVTGDWDPTLAFVMGGAILPMVFAWKWLQRRRTSLLGAPIPGPAKSEVDSRLIIGALIFGAGWGLAGICPGPAMASLSYGGTSGLIFAIAMIAGMWLAPQLQVRMRLLQTS
ncbi:DUF6691 family protein [Amaricoccus macauensis]|uniref:DUF6691 family protein n=1 Tax=Amaricoccus macauensis TaxID=57001 RepID=UPI003C7AE69D